MPPEASRLNIIDIKEFHPDELRAQVGAMFQDCVTYQATAKENIGLGSLPELEDDRGGDRGAARRRRGAGQGPAARLGDDARQVVRRGRQPIGREWQKVALSRAFMRDVRILV